MKTTLLTIALVFAGTLRAAPFTVLTYNAENLFDTCFDAGTEDYTYLPRDAKAKIPGHAEACATIGNEFRRNQCLFLDWNEEKLDKKIAAVARVLQAFDGTGRGPDLVVFQEIENRRVLDLLVDRGLADLGYDHRVLIEGDDTRGIDVAVISRFPVTRARRHPLVVDGQRLNTRGILEVELAVGDATVVVFGNHWPSQSNPTTERIAAARLLDGLARAQTADLIVALGDFNTTVNDVPGPFEFLSDFIDAEARARDLGPIFPGTQNNNGAWNSLDKIFVHRSSRAAVDYATFQIFHHPFLLRIRPETGELVPYRFNHETAEGFSDHLPVGLAIDL
jgi:endonuclease/exonuclease/phosphatase family metal-dependent hydrolase